MFRDELMESSVEKPDSNHPYPASNYMTAAENARIYTNDDSQ